MSSFTGDYMGIFRKTKPKRDKKGRYVKGSSANPKGRPRKGESLTDALQSHVDKDDLARKLLKLVNSGSLGATKYVYDRIDGKPKQLIRISNEKDNEWLDLFKGIENEARVRGKAKKDINTG